MRRITFNKSTSRRGFDPIRIPDQTQKFRNEAARTVQGMRNVQTATERNRRDQLEGLETSQKRETQIRASNKEFQDDWTKAYQKAELQPYQVAIDDAKLKAKEASYRDKDRQDLMALIPKLAKAGVQALDNHVANVQDEMRTKKLLFGLDHADVNLLVQSKNNLEDFAAQRKKLETTLLKDHTQAQVDELFGLSGNKLRIMKEVSYIQESKKLETYFADKYKAAKDGTNPGCHQVGGKEMCLINIIDPEQPYTKADLKAWKSVDAKEYIKQQFPEVSGVDGDDKLFRQYITPALNASYAQIEADFTAGQEAHAIEEDFKERLQTHTVNLEQNKLEQKNGIESAGVYTKSTREFLDKNDKVIDAVGLRANLNLYGVTVGKALETGEYTAADKRHLGNEKVTINGVTKKFKEWNPEIYADWEESIVIRQKEIENLKFNREVGLIAAADAEILQYAKDNGGLVIPKTINAMANRLFPDDPETKKKWLDSGHVKKYNLEVVHKKESNDFISKRFEEPGGITTLALLNMPWLHPDVVQDWLPKLQDAERNKPLVDQIVKGFPSLLENKLKGVVVDNDDLSSQSKEMATYATTKFMSHLRDNLGKMTYDKAVIEAREAVYDDIEKGKDIFGISKENLIFGEKGFTHLRKLPKDAYKKTVERAKANPKGYLQSEDIKNLPPKTVQDIFRQYNAGHTHPLIAHLDAAITHLSAGEITKSILNTHDIEQESIGHDRIYDFLSPNLRPVAADHRATYAQISERAKKTAAENGSLKPFEDLGQVWMEGTGTTDNPFDFSDVNSGTPKPGASSKTISELATSQTITKSSNHGAYALTVDWLNAATKSGIILSDAVFDEQTQNRIKEWVDDTETGEITFIDYTGQRVSTPGLGQNHYSESAVNKKTSFTMSKSMLETGQMFSDQQHSLLTFMQVMENPFDTQRFQPGISAILNLSLIHI